MSKESNITINGVELSRGQSMTVRVALAGFAMDLKAGLGNDDSGRDLTQAYLANIRAIEEIMYKPKAYKPEDHWLIPIHGRAIRAASLASNKIHLARFSVADKYVVEQIQLEVLCKRKVTVGHRGLILKGIEALFEWRATVIHTDQLVCGRCLAAASLILKDYQQRVEALR